MNNTEFLASMHALIGPGNHLSVGLDAKDFRRLCQMAKWGLNSSSIQGDCIAATERVQGALDDLNGYVKDLHDAAVGVWLQKRQERAKK